MKSVLLKIDVGEEDQDYVWTLNDEPMPVVEWLEQLGFGAETRRIA